VRELLGCVSTEPTAKICQSVVSVLLLPVADIEALVPQPLIQQLLHNANLLSAMIKPPTLRSPAQRMLITEHLKRIEALSTLPEMQRADAAANCQLMRVPSGSCVFYKV
jgi:hypothetical protein